jgi:hypothetical protein
MRADGAGAWDPGIESTLAAHAHRDVAPDRRASRHEMEGRWAVPWLGPAPWGCEWALFVHPLICLAEERAPVELPFALVSHKRMGPDRAADPRYLQADPRFPCLALADEPNPDGLPNRMVDGKHRLHRLLDAGQDRGLFHVFTWAQALPFIHYVPARRRGELSAAPPRSSPRSDAGGAARRAPT